MIGMVQQQVGRPVIDKTELKGLYDYILQFSPENAPLTTVPAPVDAGAGPAGNLPAAVEPLPSLFNALQQVGLKLESSKAPIEVLVIDSVQKPSEN
jgi:uncharacterized protein (TIGR03435 family)